MSLPTQTRIRLPTIKTGLKEGLTHDEIAAKLHVSEKTIDRDVSAFINSGEFDVWLKEEFIALHPIMLKTYPELVYKELAHLMGKAMTRKLEVKEEITRNVNINVKSMLAEYEHLITTTGPQTESVPGNSVNKQVHPSQANNEASQIPVT